MVTREKIQTKLGMGASCTRAGGVLFITPTETLEEGKSRRDHSILCNLPSRK